MIRAQDLHRVALSGILSQSDRELMSFHPSLRIFTVNGFGGSKGPFFPLVDITNDMPMFL